MKFDEKNLWIEDSTSPFVHYYGLGTMGIWWFDKKSLCLDYSFKLFYELPLEYPCEKHQIKEKVKEIILKIK